MKTLLLTLTIAATFVSTNAFSKQESTPNPRVVSQEEGVTAGEQSNKPADLAMVKKIRQDLMRDNNLSTKAKNVTVIVLNNGVTLKGPVNTDAERESILKHAYTAAPKHKIYNQISVVK